MESKIRIILLIIGALILLAIVWDGLRRQRKQRQSVFKRMDVNLDAHEEDDELARNNQTVQEVHIENIIEPLGNDLMEEKAQAYENILADQEASVDVDETPPEPPEEMPAQEEMPATPIEEAPSVEAIPAQKETQPKQAMIMFTLVAPEEKTFGGFSLLQTLLANGFRYGDMKIFHYHEGGDENGRALFSLAAATQNGEFDLSQMARFACKGLVLFMEPKDHDDALTVFDEMIEVSQDLADDLGGSLRIGQNAAWDEAALKVLRDELTLNH
jgi:cell division protein ZipA